MTETQQSVKIREGAALSPTDVLHHGIPAHVGPKASTQELADTFAKMVRAHLRSTPVGTVPSTQIYALAWQCGLDLEIPGGEWQDLTVNDWVKVYFEPCCPHVAELIDSNCHGQDFITGIGDMPSGMDASASALVENLSVRFIRLFDGFRDVWITRADIYYGLAPRQ